MIFNKRVFIRNKMLRNDAIYNLSFRFRDIDLNNINDIYFAINIIVIIATTLFEIFIAVIFVFKFDIVIVINVDIVVVIVIVIIVIVVMVIVVIIIIFKRSVIKLVAFDFDIKKCFIMSA